MNKQQVKGRVEQAKGVIKEKMGKVVGNKKLETEGQLGKVGGKAQAGVGDLKEDVKDTARDAQRADPRLPDDSDIDR